MTPDRWGYYETKFTRRAETAYAALIVAAVTALVLGFWPW